jgi:hypothetical protein
LEFGQRLGENFAIWREIWEWNFGSYNHSHYGLRKSVTGEEKCPGGVGRLCDTCSAGFLCQFISALKVSMVKGPNQTGKIKKTPETYK